MYNLTSQLYNAIRDIISVFTIALLFYNFYTYIKGVVGIEYAGVLLDAFVESFHPYCVKKQEQLMVTSVMSVK